MTEGGIGQGIFGFPVALSIGGSYLNPGEESRLGEALAEADVRCTRRRLRKGAGIGKGGFSG